MTLSAGAASASVAVSLVTAASTRTVTVTRAAEYAPESVSASTRWPSTTGLEALVADGAGGRVAITALPGSSGTSRIPGVPVGRYLLRHLARYYDTSADGVDLTTYSGYREVTLYAGVSTPVLLAANGLVPWDPAADQLLLYANDARLQDRRVALTLGAGATRTGGELYDWASLFTGDLLARTDRLWVVQLRSAALGDTGYVQSRAVAAGSLPGQDMAPGGLRTISATPAPVAADGTVSLDGKATRFEAAMAAAGAGGSHTYRLSATPAPLTPVRYDCTALDLLTVSGPAGLGDVAETLSYAAVAPPTYNLLETWIYTVDVVRKAAKATQGAAIWAAAVLGRLPAGSPAPAAPLVSEVRSATIDGADASGSGLTAGLTPTIAWQAPATGIPTSHQLLVWWLEALPSGETQPSLVAYLYTAGNQLTLPPGLLRAGESYAVTISAYAMPGFDVERAPRRNTIPYGRADFVSQAFVAR